MYDINACRVDRGILSPRGLTGTYSYDVEVVEVVWE